MAVRRPRCPCEDVPVDVRARNNVVDVRESMTSVVVELRT